MALVLALSQPLATSAQDVRYEVPAWELATAPWLITVGTSLSLQAEHGLVGLSEAEVAALDRNSINGFDRYATRRSSDAWARATDVLVYSSIAGALAMGGFAGGSDWRGATMAFEALGLTYLTTSLVKVRAGRTRPLAYNDGLPAEDRRRIVEDGDVRASFFSGHSSMAFAAAVFASSYYQTRYPDNDAEARLLWIGSLTAASATAFGRVQAGKHFPTDVLVGAIVGAAIGWVIPRIHEQEVSGPAARGAGQPAPILVGFRIGVGR